MGGALLGNLWLYEMKSAAEISRYDGYNLRTGFPLLPSVRGELEGNGRDEWTFC